MSNEEDPKATGKIPLKNFDFDLKMDVPEIGKTYPIYGMITNILSETPLIIMINNQIKGKCVITDPAKIEIVKSRVFEPGIFISEIEQSLPDGSYVATILTVVFGKKKEFDD